VSELTRCNFCHLQEYLRDAKEKGLRVTLISLGVSTNPYAGGVDCYIHPKEVNIKKLCSKDREKYHRSWFMELSDHCVC